uniref:2-hydroxyacyl-CoA lyase 2 n=1 Tax=Xenopus laevis TaxID=8355 RepID=HACL2_XENLA|nr:2-hydroxyacyl-CoA lyase 2 [Xenopus laevis]Q6DDK5.1 RecName: Full=2-hydroxyacyl-CoA lyase 2; AltName: Full=Acetolactate synthase-like protein; AltName: Full=IlvB-like protein [Xenopus laevis]AAH77553.1 Ilvbl-prov protein [Xenopus laevis]
MFHLIPFVVAFLLVFLTWFLIKKLRKVIIFELDQNSKHFGGELVADVLKAHDVRFLFTLCGGHISPILVAAERQNIRVIDVRHEASAVFAADAVSRLSGTVGVAAVTAGPGLTNTVTAVKNAQMAESPIVLLAGAAAGLLRGRGSLQDIDQLSLFRPLCKWSGRVNCVKDIVPMLCKAFYLARSGTPGPVLVEFPIDTLYPYSLVRQHLRISDNPQSWRQRFTNWYLRFYLFRLFANGFRIQPCLPGQVPTQIPVEIPSIPWPSTKSIDQLVWLLSQAKRPVIVVSSQALLPPVPATQTAEHVKSLRIPVYLTGMARGLLGRHHPCVFRHARRAALRVADLIILAGSVCDFRMDYGRVLNRKAKIVIINRDKKQLYLNSDIFWRPYLAIRGDVGTALKELSISLNDRFPCLSDFRCPTEWVGELLAREHHRDEEIRQSSLTQPAERINPLSVLWQLEHNGLTDQESIIVADGGDFVGSAAYILRPRGPLSWLDPGPFGTLGVGGGFALGAKLCRPQAHVWVVYGDGSAGYSLAEWDTMARHKAPAIGVIGNDACWSQIARDQLGLFGSNVACGLQSTRYDLVGAAYAGADPLNSTLSVEDSGAFLVTEKNLDNLSDYMAHARELSDRGLPSIINCNIAASGFREGSISL